MSMMGMMVRLILFAGLFVGVSLADATPVNKCIVNGTVTFQSDPCPGGQPRKQPTVQELNERERTLRRSPATPGPSAAMLPGGGAAAAAPAPTPAPALAPALAPAPAFHCDGRRRCTQMTSCAEAKYFLANCPGVEMDGDHDGIPCERQWCER